MNPIWKVKAIQVGSITSNVNGLIHYGAKDKLVDVPMWMVALTDGKHKIIVDTGIDKLEPIVNGPEPNCHRKDSELAPIALKAAVGWDADEVDLVINTHLHFDHCGGNIFFKNAQYVVQREEYEAAMEPIKSTSFLYYPSYYSKQSISYFKWRFTYGEEEIYPGLLVFPTPGHTLGSQSVLVNTSEGSLCVAGDVCSLVENINQGLEGGIVIDSKKVYESHKSIRQKADVIIPGHEYRINNLSETNFPKVL